MPYQAAETRHLAELLRRFGAELRRCRLQAGMTQMMLAERSGVPQSTISRLERGIAARSAMYRLVLLSSVLGRRMPLAYCPHEHRCVWDRLDAEGRRIESVVELDMEALGLGRF